MLKRLARGIGANAAGQLILIILQLVQVPLLIHYWGVDRYGLWLMLVTVPAYLGFSDLGFGKAAVVDITMRVAADDRPGALRTYQSAAALTVGAAILLMSVLVGICMAVPDSTFGAAATASEARYALAILLVYSIFALSGSICGGPLQATGNYAIEASCLALMWSIEGFGVILAAYFGGSMTDAALAMLGGRIFSFCLLLFMARRKAPWLRLGFAHVHMQELKRLFQPALGMMMMPLANASVLHGTAMAVGLATTPAAVPVFTASRTFARVPMQLTGIMIRATMPEFSVATAQGNRMLQVRLILLAIVASLIMLLPFAAIMLIFGNSIIGIWTNHSIAPGIAMMGIMAAVVLSNGIWVPLSNLIIATNRHQLFTTWFLLLSVFSVGVSYVTARHLGSLGGAIGLLACDFFMLLIIARIINRLFGPWSAIFAALPEAWQDSRSTLASYWKQRRGRQSIAEEK